jgi:hypothetical protein
MITLVITGATGTVTKFKEKSGSRIRKPFNSFTTKNSYTWTITQNTKSTAV